MRRGGGHDLGFGAERSMSWSQGDWREAPRSKAVLACKAHPDLCVANFTRIPGNASKQNRRDMAKELGPVVAKTPIECFYE